MSRFSLFFAVCVLSSLGIRPTQAWANESFNFDDLKTLIETRDLRTIEDTLAALPESYRSQYVLMKQSRSLQMGRPDAPRAILHGGDARFILSFNAGEPYTMGWNMLEAIQYRESTKTFEFREIRFDIPGPGLDSGRAPHQPEISEPNPSRCMGCHMGHAGNPRPNWEPFPLWPGAYGGNRDQISGEELASLKSFAEKSATHPRYGALVEIGKHYDLTGTQAGGKTNQRFTQALEKLNHVRISHEILQSKPEARWALLAGLMDCAEPESFLPQFSRPYIGILASTEESLYRNFDDIDRDRSADELQLTSKMRFVAENQGFNFNNWSLSIYGILSFADGAGGIRAFPRESLLLASDSRATLTCDELKARSLRALGDRSY